MRERILLLEDDRSLVEGLCYSLQKREYQVTVAGTVREAEALLDGGTFDLLLLDVTLPDGTGFALCERQRSRGDQVPILFLTASDEELNVIRGLDSGGDDYVTKPFKLGELLSRIQALLRRAGMRQMAAQEGMQQVPVQEETLQEGTRQMLPQEGAQQMPAGEGMHQKLAQGITQQTPAGAARADDMKGAHAQLASGDLFIDLEGCRVLLAGRRLELTQVEYRLLCLLVRRSGGVVTRDMILEELWDGQGSFVDDNTLSVYIRRLREKMEADPSHPRHLLTARGFGYRWEA